VPRRRWSRMPWMRADGIGGMPRALSTSAIAACFIRSSSIGSLQGQACRTSPGARM